MSAYCSYRLLVASIFPLIGTLQPSIDLLPVSGLSLDAALPPTAAARLHHDDHLHAKAAIRRERAVMRDLMLDLCHRHVILDLCHRHVMLEDLHPAMGETAEHQLVKIEWKVETAERQLVMVEMGG